MTDTRNPKDLIGKTKTPISLWPISATIQGAMALFAGKTKYGRTNWRATPVYASIYYEALLRHASKWWEGEDKDSDDGTPHLGNCLACLAILIDAKVCGTLIDDRQFNGAKVVESFNQFNGLIPEIEKKYADKSPKQYTIEDTRVKGLADKVRSDVINSVVSDDSIPGIIRGTTSVISGVCEGTHPQFSDVFIRAVHLGTEPTLKSDFRPGTIWEKPVA